MKKVSFLFLAIALLSSCAPKVNKVTRIYGDLPAGLDEINIKSEKLDSFVRGDKGKFCIELPTDLTKMYILECGVSELQVIPDGTKLDVFLGDSCYVKSRTPEISAQERLNAFVEKASVALDYEELKTLALRTINAEKDNVIGALAFQSSYVLLTDDELGQALRTLSSKVRGFGVLPVIERIYNARNETSSGCYFRDFSVRTITSYDYGVPRYSNVNLSDYAGKGRFILLYFWNSRDENSLEQVPYVKRVKNEFGKQGLEVVSVALYGDAEEDKAVAEEQGFNWVALNGADDSVSDLYGLAVLPEVVYIAPDGTILNRELSGEDIYSAAKHYFEQQAQMGR